jgi:tetratricopeptide (TPR) repeat protein
MQKVMCAVLALLFFAGSAFCAGQEFKNAMRLNRQGNSEEATAAFKKVLKESPNSIDGMLAAGMLEVQKGNYNGAKPHFEKVLTQKPDSIAANFMLAMIYERQENDAKALPHWQIVSERAKGNLKELAKKHIKQLQQFNEEAELSRKTK